MLARYVEYADRVPAERGAFDEALARFYAEHDAELGSPKARLSRRPLRFRSENWWSVPGSARRICLCMSSLRLVRAMGFWGRHFSAQCVCSVQVDGTDLDLFVIFQEVAKRGGYEAVTINRQGLSPALLITPLCWVTASTPTPYSSSKISGLEHSVVVCC